MKNLTSFVINEASSEIIDKMKNALKEEFNAWYDYIIVNDDLDKAVSYVHELIQSEHGRTMRNTQLIDRIQNELAVFAKGEVK